MASFARSPTRVEKHDDVFGAIIDQVRASGQPSKTLVIFTSDNGLMYGEHGLSKKYVPYSPSVRVPPMLAYPGVSAPGTASAAAAPEGEGLEYRHPSDDPVRDRDSGGPEPAMY
ncbi:MAG: sulfatase-like hydrolase/transferase [Tetrasphaera sp.]|nr:sulfatase-like hydrolase/transferase [Tetrasphaera sp.]